MADPVVTGTSQPLVTVVMIFRDPPPAFFTAAIESVLAQTHTALELLLCDDGSAPSAVVQAAAVTVRAPDRIRLLHHPGGAHRGMTASRRLGVVAARGDLVAFLDADDVWEPDHVAHEVALLGRHPEADAVCGRAWTWRSWDGSSTPDVLEVPPWPAGSVVPAPGLLSAVLNRGSFSTPTCSLLVRRRVLLELGAGDEDFTAMFEDQVLLAKLYLAVTCVVSGTATAWYRQHPGSSSHLARADGSYHPGAPNPSHERYVRWLSARPELTRTEPTYAELRAQLDQVLRTYQSAGHLAGRAGSWVGAARRRGGALAGPTGRRIVGAVRQRVRRRIRESRRTAPLFIEPVSRQFGYDRGLPVDRYYIEGFLARNGHLIAGRVLEVGDDSYTRRFGGHRVRQVDVLNIDPTLPGTTLVADLADADQLPSGAFDCLVITQTLQLVFDLRAAVATLHRILRPGGSALVTVPAISQLSSDRWAEGWCWGITPVGARRLFGEVFPADAVEVHGHGNLASTTAFLQGRAASELRHPDRLGRDDPQYPMLVTIRADKPAEA